MPDFKIKHCRKGLAFTPQWASGHFGAGLAGEAVPTGDSQSILGSCAGVPSLLNMHSAGCSSKNHLDTRPSCSPTKARIVGQSAGTADPVSTSLSSKDLQNRARNRYDEIPHQRPRDPRDRGSDDDAVRVLHKAGLPVSRFRWTHIHGRFATMQDHSGNSRNQPHPVTRRASIFPTRPPCPPSR